MTEVYSRDYREKARACAAAEGPTELSISKVLADERTNKLVVIADEKSFQRIQELVAQLDLPTAGGARFSLASARGQVVVVSLWAT